jgi:hypothetical protein
LKRKTISQRKQFAKELQERDDKPKKKTGKRNGITVRLPGEETETGGNPYSIPNTRKKQEAEKARKAERDANFKNISGSPADRKKRIKSPTRSGMRTPPVDLTDRAEFFRDCKPSEIHQRKLDYQEYCETVLEHPGTTVVSKREDRAKGVMIFKMMCTECGKALPPKERKLAQ